MAPVLSGFTKVTRREWTGHRTAGIAILAPEKQEDRKQEFGKHATGHSKKDLRQGRHRGVHHGHLHDQKKFLQSDRHGQILIGDFAPVSSKFTNVTKVVKIGSAPGFPRNTFTS